MTATIHKSKFIGSGVRIEKPVLRLLSVAIFLFFLFFSYSGADSELADTQYKEDLNQDGSVNITDVIALMLLGLSSPGDPRADYNGDGAYSITDAIRLLLNIMGANLTPLSGTPVIPGALEVYSTFNAIGLQLPYSGDLEDSTRALLFWRREGDPLWRNGVEMTVDAESRLIRASIYPLEPDEEIDVRVVFHGPDSPGIPQLETRTRTRRMILEPAGGQSYYVSPDGDDTNPGTLEEPFNSLAYAAGIVGAGDIVYAMNGVYREGDLFSGLKGTASDPIVFTAAAGEQPILDSSFEIPRGSTAWRELSGEVYSTTLKLDIEVEEGTGYGYVAQDGDRMFNYNKLTDLTGDVLNVPRAWYLNERTNVLFIRTGNGDTPENYSYNIAQHRYACLLSGSEYVVVRGFEMRNCGQAAVRLSEGAVGCVVIDNIIHNAPNGIYLKHETTRDNALWRNRIYEPGLVDIPWNSIKAGNYPRQGILSDVTGRGNSFNYNILDGWFDGITIEIWQMPSILEAHRDCDVMYNRAYNIGDDAFELDGGGINMRLHGNSARNAMVAISLAPIERGPVYVTRNDVTFMNLMFKLNVGTPYSLGWTYVYHNSGYGLNSGNGMAMIGLTGKGSGGPETRNKIFENNAMIGADRAVRTGYDGNNLLDYNSYYHVPGQESRKFEWNGVTYSSLEAFQSATGQESHGLYADPRFVSTPGLGETPWQGFWADQIGNYPLVSDTAAGDLKLKIDSPLIDRGLVIRGVNEDYSGAAPDIGAFEYGAP